MEAEEIDTSFFFSTLFSFAFDVEQPEKKFGRNFSTGKSWVEEGRGKREKETNACAVQCRCMLQKYESKKIMCIDFQFCLRKIFFSPFIASTAMQKCFCPLSFFPKGITK